MPWWWDLVRARVLERLRALVFRGRANRELEEEIRLHIERSVERDVAGGMSEAEAQRKARREFGNEVGVREHCRDGWGTRVVDDLGRDLGQAVRSLWSVPGYTGAVIGVLALGIGTATADHFLRWGVWPMGCCSPRSRIPMPGGWRRWCKSTWRRAAVFRS